MAEWIYRDCAGGYRQQTGDKITRCKDCRHYAGSVVKYSKEDENGSYCRFWRSYVKEKGFCHEGKPNGTPR